MKQLRKVAVALLLALVMVVSVVSTAFAANAKAGTVRVGVGKGDITGPITDISTGYNSLGDLMKGLLTRLNARAFIVETNGEPQVYVSAELVHMTESIKPGVLKELKKRGLSQYNEQNTMIAATHAHSSTSNTSWYALYDLINGVPG
ncbi:MAG: neutral/alkaline non-lysosomal ceramidase N-terminal domain-containing protein, partial [Acutalibacteraceae bacterium]|nr:neutral/alkaline non-lysosomal ceramidase N-terminal domain-containing protein [Acutalibacteraceae bacterium]